MSKKKKKTTFEKILHSRFYQIYFGVVALVLIAMCVGRVWLNGVLVDYETAQPVHVAEKVANLFETADYDTIYQLDTSAADFQGGDEDFYLESMQALSNGKVVGWSEAYSPNSDVERRYAVTLDGDRFANFTLVPSGETTRHGNVMWKLGSVSTLVQVEATPEPTPEPEPGATPEPPAAQGIECRIKAPNDYAVTVDGVQLSSDNASVSTKSVVPDGFLPAGVTGVTYTEYLYTAGSDAPVIEVKDPSGAAQQVTQTSANTWSCPVPSDPTLQQQYSDAALSLAKRIAKVTARDASVDSMVSICAGGSPAREMFKNYSNRWATPHRATDFQNVQVSEFYAHSEDCFTCHITFDFVLATSSGNKSYPTAYTFCIIRQGGKGKLYNLLMQ